MRVILIILHRSFGFRCGLASLSKYRSLVFILFLYLFMSQAGSVYSQDTWTEPEFSQGRAWDEPVPMTLGEIMFRLYMQAHAAGVPAFVTFIMNPTLGVHRLITRWEPPVVENNLHKFQVYLAAAYSSTDYSVSGLMVDGRQELFSDAVPFVDVGFHVIYGDPFVQGTWIPFRHFELLASFGSDMHRHNDFRFFSDGYLFSFSPLHTETRALSTGLSLHFDFVSLGDFCMYYGIINMYSNALGWTVKYRHLFSPGIGWRARAHAGFTFFGASSYHHPSEVMQTELLNYGYGINLKHLSSLELGRRNRLDIHNFFYFQWSYPGTGALSRGFVRWQFHDFTFSHMVSQRISLGGTFSLATERGSFGEFPSTRKNHWSVRTFVAWNGNNIRGDR